MLGISTEVWLAVGTVAGGVGTIAVPVAGWALSSLRGKHAAELRGVLESCTTQIELVKAAMVFSSKEIARDVAQVQKEVHESATASAKQDELAAASLKAAWVVLDDLRFNAVRRQDQDKMREEFRADMKTLGDRLEAAITALRNDIHRDAPGGA